MGRLCGRRWPEQPRLPLGRGPSRRCRRQSRAHGGDCRAVPRLCRFPTRPNPAPVFTRMSAALSATQRPRRRLRRRCAPARSRPRRSPRRRSSASPAAHAPAERVHDRHRRPRPGRGRGRGRGRRGRAGPRAAGRRALRGQEPLRPRRHRHDRRLEDPARRPARRPRRHRGGSGCGTRAPSASARSTWASSPTTSSPRTRTRGPRHNPRDLDPLGRRVVGRIGGRRRGRARAPRPRHRYQRLDSRALVVLRALGAEADVRPAVARRDLSRSSSASITSVRSRDRSPTSRWPTTHAGPGRARSRCARRARLNRPSPALDAGHRRPARRRCSAATSRRGGDPAVHDAVESGRRCARRARGGSNCPASSSARAAAFLITATEGGRLHLDRLQSKPADFDPGRSRPPDRRRDAALGVVSAGPEASAPGGATKSCAVFRDVDVLLAPATPVPATLLGQETMTVGGREMLVRPNLGLFTQPISFIGLPVVAAPVQPRPARCRSACSSIGAPWARGVAAARRASARKARRLLGARSASSA